MRCSVCDRSDLGLSTYRADGGFAHDFVKDPKDPKGGFLCGECSGAYQDLMTEFYIEDDAND